MAGKNMDQKLLALANDLDYWNLLNSSDAYKIRSEKDFLQTSLLIKIYLALGEQNKVMAKLEEGLARIADALEGEK